MSRQPAILLLGPTGAGKSPLGDYLAAHGFRGQRCIHFDFGAQLRRVATCGDEGLTEDDVAYVRKVLSEGALLENETFHIARTILDGFIVGAGTGPNDVVVLNGLPRHVGQARDMATIVDVRMVVSLQCTAETVRARIAANSGGDRTGRTDDSLKAIEAKLEIYAARTYPLLDHYRVEGVQHRLVPVDVRTAPSDIVSVLRETKD